MPGLKQPVLARGQSVTGLQDTLNRLYQHDEVFAHPFFSIALRAFGSLQVFVGGEVQRPGYLELTGGERRVLQVITSGGGFLPTARTHEVLILRTQPDGTQQIFSVDVSKALSGEDLAQNVRIRPLDVVMVPRSDVASLDVWVDQHIRQALPISSSASLTFTNNPAALAGLGRLMDALPPGLGRSDPSRPELGALLATVAMLVDDQRSIVLHVTASRHGEGTTTVARELAAATARAAWCRVALVDAAAMPAELALPPLLGPFARGQEPALRPGRIGGADVALARLTGPGDAAPRLESLRGLFAWMRSQFTVVVVDSPPVLPCREGAITAAVADGTLLVVEAERTRRADIARAREVLDQLGATMLGVVLNKRRHRVPGFVERML